MNARINDGRSASACGQVPVMPDGALSHVRVIELGSFIAGPFCGQLLADLGAEVIKVEPPIVGDAMRQWGAVKATNGRSLWWSVIGRNKRSITLDLRKPEGQRIVRELARDADVLIENFRPGTLERWGLAPGDLRQENDRLIVARVSGFGQTGPYSDKAGFGAVAEAASGLRSLTGHPDRMPARVGISIGDSLAGLYAAIGVLAALVARPGRKGGAKTSTSRLPRACWVSSKVSSPNSQKLARSASVQARFFRASLPLTFIRRRMAGRC
jgi:crotonobetainyl-CoA:carnitine CoA-transferase CaiB-like acyl-CoA transferase